MFGREITVKHFNFAAKKLCGFLFQKICCHYFACFYFSVSFTLAVWYNKNQILHFVILFNLQKLSAPKIKCFWVILSWSKKIRYFNIFCHQPGNHTELCLKSYNILTTMISNVSFFVCSHVKIAWNFLA